MNWYPAHAISEEAFRAFDRWRDDHDPDGLLDILEAAEKYNDWALHNDVSKYLDAAQPSPQVSEGQS